MRPVSDAQVRKLMEEMSKHGQIGQAAMTQARVRTGGALRANLDEQLHPCGQSCSRRRPCWRIRLFIVERARIE